MKKIALLLTLAVIISCNDDIVEGPAAGFYPTAVIEALEEDGIAYQVTLSATGELNQGGVVQIEFNNHEFIATDPAHVDGVLQLNIGSGGSAIFTVEALDDDIQGNYTSTFEITDTGGDITGIANSKFTFIVEDDDLAILYGDDFESGIGDWETEDLGTGNDWRGGDFSGNAYADISNFSSGGITEAWLLSPEIDFDAGDNEVLNFETQPRFNEEIETFEAYIVNGYTPGSDPSNATLTKLSFEIDDHTGGGFGDFVNSGDIDLSTMTGTSRIAFYYKAGDASDGSGWSVDNVFLTSFHPDNSDGIPNDEGGSGGSGGGCPNPITQSDISLPFSDDFESCSTVGDFNIPTGWIEAIVDGSKTDRGWGCRAFGKDGSSAPRGSGFGGEDGVDNAWLITDGKLDLTSETTVTLKFWIESRFSGPGDVFVHWSTDYAGTGDPTCATWTELTDVQGQMPADGSETFTEITSDLSGAAGEKVHLAFQYVGGESGSSIALTLDDVSITGN